MSNFIVQCARIGCSISWLWVNECGGATETDRATETDFFPFFLSMYIWPFIHAKRTNVKRRNETKWSRFKLIVFVGNTGAYCYHRIHLFFILFLLNCWKRFHFIFYLWWINTEPLLLYSDWHTLQYFFFVFYFFCCFCMKFLAKEMGNDIKRDRERKIN